MNVDPKRAQELFAHALAINDADQRLRFLKSECSGNTALFDRVARLLAAFGQPREFLDQPTESPVASPGDRSQHEQPGTVIAGRFKLLESIGEGGMGTVWVAEQLQPVRRKVALKLVKAGMDSRQVLARFDAERQALALMDHPNIAKVFDGGLTDQGRPFFAMEYVKGMPLTEYCDQVRLTVEDRLRLFIPICQAVQHAHQKGIIHRDLKPSNVLICLYDGKPVPKVIDFGLAKAMHQPLTERTVHTGHGLMIGTPLYMSPEQAEHNNLDVDTRTDIYSLGVMLYELLTGTTPLEVTQLKEAAFQEILRLIKDVEPPKPSTRISSSASLPNIAAQRSLDHAQLSRRVRGDLDWIVMKALDKERDRRYETANGLARDIERFLSDEAVEACPPSASYRLKKYYRRNRAAFLTAASFACLLVGGAAISIWQAVRATNAESLASLRLGEVQIEQSKTRQALQASQASESKALEASEAEKIARAAEAEQRQQAEQQRDEAQRLQSLATLKSAELQQLTEAQRRVIYASEMNLVRIEAQRGNLPRMREVLLQQLPGSGDEDLRDWEWNYWYRFLHRAEVVRRFEDFKYGAPDSAIAVAPGAKLVALTRGDKTEWMEIDSGKPAGSVPMRLRIGVNRTSLSQSGRMVESGAISQAAYWPDTYRIETPTEFAIWESSGEKRSFAFPPDTLKLVSFMQLSADGTRVAAVGNDISHEPGKPASRLLVWDVESGGLLLNQVEQRELNRLALSTDGKLLLAFVCHSTLRRSDERRPVATLIDVATGESLGTAWHNDDIDSAYLLPDGKHALLATLGYSGANRKELLKWEVGNESPQKLTSESMPDYVKGAVSPDGGLFAVSGHTVSTIRLIDTRYGNLVSTLHNEATTIESLTFSADGTQLVACSTTGEVLRWDLGQDADLFRLRANPLGPMAYSGYALRPDQSLLAYATEQGSVRLRSPDGKETVLSEGNPNTTRYTAKLVFSPNGQFLAHVSMNAVELYDVAAGKQLWRWTPTPSTQRIAELLTRTQSIQNFAFSSDGERIVFDQASKWIILDTATGDRLRTNAETTFTQHLWADNEGRLLTASKEASEKDAIIVRDILNDVNRGRADFSSFVGVNHQVWGSPDGKHLAIAGNMNDDVVEIWDFQDPQKILEVPGRVVAFSADGQLVAIGEATPLRIVGVNVNAGSAIQRVHSVSVWDLPSRRRLASISLSGSHADEMRFSPDGRRLLTLHGKHAIGSGGAIPEGRLWDVVSGREIMSIPVAEVNHYIWDLFYDESGHRLTLMVLSKSAGTGGGWGATVYDATPLSDEEDAQLIARHLVMDLLAECPLPSDAIEKLKNDPKLRPSVRQAAVGDLQQRKVDPQELSAFCLDIISDAFSTKDRQQAALRCAQTLAELEPGSLRARVNLGGAQYRVGLVEQARATLEPTPDEATNGKAAYEDEFAFLREAFLVLVHHQLGNSDEAKRDSEALFSSLRAIPTSSITISSGGGLPLVMKLFFEARQATQTPLNFGVTPAVTYVPDDGQLLDMFQRADENSNGRLEVSETDNTKTPIRPGATFDAWDINTDGYISTEEFMSTIRARIESGKLQFRRSISLGDQLHHFNETLQRTPDDATTLNNRAWLLATYPQEEFHNGKQAIEDATKACELTQWNNPSYLATLAAAHAATGNFDEAVKWQEKSLASVPPELRAVMQSRLELYRERKPYLQQSAAAPVPTPRVTLDANRDRLDYERALSDAVAQCNQDDKNLAAWNMRGEALYRLGKFGEAMSALEKSQQIQSQSGKEPHPVNLLFLAMTYHQLKNPERARARLLQSEHAAKSSPQDASLWQRVVGEAESLLGIDLAVVNSVPIEGWGQAVDPLGDCRVRAEGDRLKFSMPNSPHDLSVKKCNAPRVLQSVVGDFQLEVKVNCDLQPKSVPPGGTIAYQGAGLLLWADPLHFLRVERNAYWLVSAQSHFSFVPSIEHVQGERSKRSKPRTEGIGFHERHTWLRVKRHGNKFTTTISHDGQTWEEPVETEAVFPDRVWVGVAAVNYSLDPFDVEFAEFKLTPLTVDPPQP